MHALVIESPREPGARLLAARHGGFASQWAAFASAPNNGALIALRRCSAVMNSRSKLGATDPFTRSSASSASDHAWTRGYSFSSPHPSRASTMA